MYRVTQKKCNIRNPSSNLFQKSDFTFPHVLWNQNFEPVSSSHFNITHSELIVPQKRQKRMSGLWHFTHHPREGLLHLRDYDHVFFLFLNSCCCGYLGLHLGTFEVQGRQLTPIIWVCETSSLAPPEIEPHEHKRVLYFDDVRRGEIYLSAHAFPVFLGHYWFWMSNINEAR